MYRYVDYFEEELGKTFIRAKGRLKKGCSKVADIDIVRDIDGGRFIAGYKIKRRGLSFYLTIKNVPVEIIKRSTIPQLRRRFIQPMYGIDDPYQQNQKPIKRDRDKFYAIDEKGVVLEYGKSYRSLADKLGVREYRVKRRFEKEKIIDGWGVRKVKGA